MQIHLVPSGGTARLSLETVASVQEAKHPDSVANDSRSSRTYPVRTHELRVAQCGALFIADSCHLLSYIRDHDLFASRYRRHRANRPHSSAAVRSTSDHFHCTAPPALGKRFTVGRDGTVDTRVCPGCASNRVSSCLAFSEAVSASALSRAAGRRWLLIGLPN
jgi:hypothetical protein